MLCSNLLFLPVEPDLILSVTRESELGSSDWRGRTFPEAISTVYDGPMKTARSYRTCPHDGPRTYDISFLLQQTGQHKI